MNRKILKFLLAIAALASFALPLSALATASSTTYTAPGNYTFTVPTGVTSITVEAWGGGGTGGPATGNGSAGGGGAGGCYVSSTFSVAAGATYGVTVAASSTALTSTLVNGNDSTFGTTTVVAKGGAGGAIATSATSTPGQGSSTNCVGPGATTLTYDIQSSGPGGLGWGNVSAQTAVGQSVTPTSTFSLTRAVISLLKLGAPVDNLYVSIATSINGADAASSSLVAGSSLSGASLTDTNFDFTTPYSITQSTSYFVRVNRTGAVDASNYYSVGKSNTDLYSGGTTTLSNAGTWAFYTTDIAFSLQNITTPPTVTYRGGSGATSTVATASGGGGGGAGSTGVGGNAGTPTATSSGSGTSVGGGNGGNGTTVSATQNPGFAAGGGGGGGRASNATDRAGGGGAAGMIKVSYNIVASTPIAREVSFAIKNALFRLNKALLRIQN